MIWHEFQRPAQVEPEQEEHSETFARFLAQPFERGWGTTVGNALRRALLSSIPSAAITAVKIEGADHEFSAVPGVVEDVTDIILNLKKIPLKIHGNEPVFMLRVRGDSMIDAGIFDGDYVVVKRQPDARDGQMVAALVDGEEATVKRIQRMDNRVILKAENPNYPPMVFSDGVEILGVVVAVLRRVD